MSDTGSWKKTADIKAYQTAYRRKLPLRVAERRFLADLGAFEHFPANAAPEATRPGSWRVERPEMTSGCGSPAAMMEAF